MKTHQKTTPPQDNAELLAMAKHFLEILEPYHRTAERRSSRLTPLPRKPKPQPENRT